MIFDSEPVKGASVKMISHNTKVLVQNAWPLQCSTVQEMPEHYNASIPRYHCFCRRVYSLSLITSRTG